MIYIASPYTCDNSQLRAQRAEAAAALAGELLCNGVLAYSPIAHGHAVYEATIKRGRAALEFHYGAWRAHSLRMLRMCEALEVLALPGWRESVGVADEMAAASAIGMPIRYWCMRGDSFVACSLETAP